jgi:uncharacterized protein YraI
VFNAPYSKGLLMMKKNLRQRMHRWGLMLVALMLLPVSVAIAQDARSVTVKFPRGASGTTIGDSIRGYESVNYKIGVSASQQMTVSLETSNASNYFNITAPGASEALFVGSINGTSTSFEIPSSGTYVISVYLMRNAARRNERASYKLSINVDNSVSGQTQAPSQTQPDFADGLSGGPDHWRVQGLGGDTLNVRADASTSAKVLTLLYEGDVIRNLGCKLVSGTRWCHVETDTGLRGWVAGRFLHEDFEDSATTLPSFPVLPIPVQPVRPVSVDTSLMPRYCVGEASAKYGVRPQRITANTAFKSGNRYVSQGYFDGDNGTTFFNCWFDLNGNFVSVS